MNEDTTNWKKSIFMQGRTINPVHWKRNSGIEDIVENFEKTCFEARRIAAGAKLFRKMIEGRDTIWLSIAGAGIVGGMGGYIIDLIKNGFIDVICSTGAQIYHDAHFAFGLPVVQGSSNVDDNSLDKDGTTRIFDIYIRAKETLREQDLIFRKFAEDLAEEKMSSADYNHKLGRYITLNAPYPEKSFVAVAADAGIPIFLDSEGNHSIGMNNAFIYLSGKNVDPSPSLSLLEAMSINYFNSQLGYFELGGGGPKNWIQQISPLISQIFGKNFEGAERGIQITTADERDGSLSGCTFGEGVTWGKYKDATQGLIQIRGDYSVIAPILIGYVLETCQPRQHKKLIEQKRELCYRMLNELKNGS